MWIKEPPKDLFSQESNVSNLNFLFQSGKFYIMDNHLAAAWCWLNELNPKSHYNFFHIDQHEDLLCDAPVSSYENLRENPNIDLDDFVSLNYAGLADKNFPVFRYDNYIIQAKNIFPHWFDMCYFACPDNISDSHLNITYNADCYELSTNIAYWVHDGKDSPYRKDPERLNKWILNIDIDYFFKDHFQLFTDEYILELCDNILEGMDDIDVVTIALSPECCGSWESSCRIAKLMSDRLGLDFDLEEFI